MKKNSQEVLVDTPDSDAEVMAFQVADTDLGPYLVDVLGQPVDAMSPVAPDLAGYAPGSCRPSAELQQEVLAEPRAGDVAAVLACPSFKLWGRSGGGRTPFSSYAICGRPATHPDLYVAASPSFENAWLFEVLDGVEEVAAWWADTFAAPVDETMPNLLPPPIEIESLLYAFHTIDAFRRVTMQGMLDYRTTSEPAVPVEDFITSMRRSIASNDLRWLMPTFMHLVPGLDLGNIDIRDEHLQSLIDQTLFEAAAEEQDGTEVLVFGEAGIALGMEFYDGWLSSAGYELVVRSGGAQMPLARGFLAPTPVTNHLILLGANGESVNHQAMTTEHLAIKLVELLTDAEGRAEEPVAVEVAEEPSAVEVAEEPPVGTAAPKAPSSEAAVPVLIAESGERHALGARTTVGRGLDNDLVISSATTSGHHSVVLFDAGALTVEDLGSSNGTWIGADRVVGCAALADGVQLRFGETGFTVELPPGAEAAMSTDQTVALPIETVFSSNCPSCGSEVTQGARFCRSCGHKLGS